MTHQTTFVLILVICRVTLMYYARILTHSIDMMLPLLGLVLSGNYIDVLCVSAPECTRVRACGQYIIS